VFRTLLSRDAEPSDLSLEAFAKAVQAGGATVVDVREPHEFKAGHIPGSVNQPLSRFDPRDLPKAGLVVLICQAGSRSRNALQRAHAAGRSDVRHFAGGMSQWRTAGRTVAN
jgi:rhodanese-related sulfurtransferase